MRMAVTTDGSAFHEVCCVDDLWVGEMEVFKVGAGEVLLIKHDRQFFAYQARCPHQDAPLVEGKLEKGVLTCRVHLWQFAAATGCGINPATCRLTRYPVEIQDGTVRVGEKPVSA
jgi:nitrite reductase/ring-hydroxylating ferredoxin subunit